MKYKNIKLLANKVAKMMNTNVMTIHNHVGSFVINFTDNYFALVIDEDVENDVQWFTLADYSTGKFVCIHKGYTSDYRTQKHFIDDMEIALNQYDEECHEKELSNTAETEQEEPTKQEVTTQTTIEELDNNMYPICERIDETPLYKYNVNVFKKYRNAPWARKPKLSKEKLTIYRAFWAMVRDAYRYKNTIDRLFTVHRYLMKLHFKGKITTAEYYFYTNKLENMYNECLR